MNQWEKIPLMKREKNHQYKNFKLIFLKYLPQDYINFFNPEDLELFLQDRWHFFESKQKQIYIRCYNSEKVWPLHTSIVEINLKDMPFIVDTVLDYLKSEGYRIFRMINSIFFVKRDSKGRIISISPNLLDAHEKESYIYIEIEKVSLEELAKIKNNITRNIQELILIVSDFPKIQRNLSGVIYQNRDLQEEKFWVTENFIQMGYLLWEKNRIEKPLGILTEKSYQEIVLEEIQSLNRLLPRSQEDILYKESVIKSNVKRYKPLHIIIFHYNQQNHVLIGSFAGKGEISPRFLIPPIKRKLDTIAKNLNAPYNGFKYKEIFKISQLIPLGILFSRDITLLQEWFDFFVHNLYINEQKILISLDKKYDGIWILIIELQRFADSNHKFKEILTKNSIKVDTFFKRTYNQFLYSFIYIKSEQFSLSKLKNYIEKHKEELFYSWFDKFAQYITFSEPSLKLIKQKIEYYQKIIPSSLFSYISPREAYKNLQILEKISTQKKFYVDFGNSISPLTEKEELTLNIYTCYPFTLTDIFPVLQSIGLVITTEIAFDFPFSDGVKYLNIFYLENQIHSKDRKFLKKLAIGIEEILNQKHSVEKINALLILTDLTIREIAFIKTLISYYYQLHKQFSRIFLQDFFIQHPDFANMIIQYLHNILGDLDSDISKKEKKRIEELKSIQHYIANLKTISEQTVASNLKEVLENIVRTNYYLELEDIAIKVQTKNISYLLEPKPLFEIFIYSKNWEGIHIRSDYVARGGIRWSDRIDDFRIEIYDLMKTQMIKNTVIVPNGAKGGFIIKENLSNQSREERKQISEKYYKKYIFNLLSITDNLDRQGKIIVPEKTVRLDRQDPYLVVAADKGTATFSDTANQIALEQNFWLKDAFASGGTHGYDHKKQGITAKGAWESVKRHFLEKNMDPEKDEIIVIGIGDMSGDVFGNGMLLSKKIRLIAAFNHIHIFVDPDPDPEVSYKERLRLFKEVKGWNHYNPQLISKGGGVFERNAARIKISKEIQKRFEINKQIVSGEELIRYILKAPADLLWNGGIGTYIKSSQETHKEVMDPSNDAVRIDAKDLRVRVIGEGGNLGLTMSARIEASRKGVALNTDFIDNSGGVDMSDHEVNLKIVLNYMMNQKEIDLKKRNQWIRKFEKEMIHKVLQNNQFNNLAIALETIRLLNYFYLIPSWITFLKQEKIVPEEDLIIIDDITSPQICQLIGYTKLYLKNYLNSIDFCFDDSTNYFFISEYFPHLLVNKYNFYLDKHPLKNQIVRTYALNDFINSLGTLHCFIFHNVTNKDYSTLLKEYIWFRIMMGQNVFDIYKEYFALPKASLYEQLLNISYMIGFIHILIDKENIRLLKDHNSVNFKKFLKNFEQLLLKESQLKIPSSVSASEQKKWKEIFIKSDAIFFSIVYYFLQVPLEEKEFFFFLKDSRLDILFSFIQNVSVQSLQELKFQFRIAKIYFSFIKGIGNGKRNQSELKKKISNSIDPFLKKEKVELIDLFELVMQLENFL